MKQIIIFLLVLILLIIGYSQYKQYKRFTPPEYEYQVNDGIDLQYHDRSFLLSYYQAVENLNGYVISQWSNEGVDVRNPEDDDEETKAATAEYARKLGMVKFYEDQLVKASELKKEGFDNTDIRMLEAKGISAKAYSEQQAKNTKRAKFMDMFERETAKNNIRLGSKSAFVFEIQKMLVDKGYDIPIDGVFKFATSEALGQFEEKNGLFRDGLLDTMTLERLLD